MILKCIAIDDEPLALNLIRNYAAKIPALHLIQTFNDALSGAEFLRHNPVDVLFLDINMPDISGLDLIRSLNEKPQVIFTTAYKDFAYEGFELDALDYLLKPITFERFGKAFQKALDYYSAKQIQAESHPESLVVSSEYQRIKIALSDIEFIESSEKYIKIHLVKAKPVLTLISLNKVLEKLPEDKFKRIHRRFIVNVFKVKFISNQKVQLTSGVKLPIGKTYLHFIEEWLHY
ncbi:response regulator transcription factor [Adhaeribacter sp. BT258]|uniref:Response regulator transcription factor n=1 Tax=Adhaeribacter terrigena TaxID=2793070 RepID=A0ABS1BXL6_9BACT|nr:LytTR family DNA-binding domain-containing protein [Adhaeribacter terrigena]MBK0401892.1 response regulator transcription factor [Adhaeribacter terrigena]